jgi:PAS domain-containing protein
MIDARNHQTGWINSLIDISEPIKIREELAISQQRFITVLEGLDAAISVLNPKNGELLFTNGRYREMFGNSPKSHLLLIGNEPTFIDDLLVEEDSIDIYAGLPSFMLNPITSDASEVQLPNNSENWYEVRSRYIPWTDGHLAQLLITTDITVRKHTEQNLRNQEEKLQFSSRLTTMGEMASSIAHELNQPLAAINNYCMGVITRIKNLPDPTIQKEILPALERASAQALRAGTITTNTKFRETQCTSTKSLPN